jgi:hypothetical protein
MHQQGRRLLLTEEVMTMTTLERTAGARDVMELLRQGVPLTLLLDLADPRGPRSLELLLLERDAA